MDLQRRVGACRLAGFATETHGQENDMNDRTNDKATRRRYYYHRSYSLFPRRNISFSSILSNTGPLISHI